VRETAGAIFLIRIPRTMRHDYTVIVELAVWPKFTTARKVKFHEINAFSYALSAILTPKSWNRSEGLMLDDLVTSFANNVTTSFNGSVEFMLEYSWVRVVTSYENTFSVNERQMAFSQRGRNYVFSTKVSKFSKY